MIPDHGFSSSPVLCVGGAHIDRLGRTYGKPILGTSNPGNMASSQGGVARNVAENLVRLDCPVTLLSRLGKDEAGKSVLDSLGKLGINTSLVTLSDEYATGSFTAITGNDGEMVIGFADMDIYRELTPELIGGQLHQLRQYPYWFIDSNLPAVTLEILLENAGSSKTCVGAVSIEKAERLKPSLGRFDYLFANLREGIVLAGLDPDGDYEPKQVAYMLQAAGCSGGVLTASRSRIVAWEHGELATLPVMAARMHDANGAGDSLTAGTIYGLRQGLSLMAAVQWGLAAASVTVESHRAVSSLISISTLENRFQQFGIA